MYLHITIYFLYIYYLNKIILKICILKKSIINIIVSYLSYLLDKY